jgi:hypothetical protein
MRPKKTVVAAFTADGVVHVARVARPDVIPGGHGCASVSDDAPRRNAAVAARLSSIRQS